jgi:hypothetical protein
MWPLFFRSLSELMAALVYRQELPSRPPATRHTHAARPPQAAASQAAGRAGVRLIVHAARHVIKVQEPGTGAHCACAHRCARRAPRQSNQKNARAARVGSGAPPHRPHRPPHRPRPLALSFFALPPELQHAPPLAGRPAQPSKKREAKQPARRTQRPNQERTPPQLARARAS